MPAAERLVSQRHVKSRGESASGCSRSGRFPVRAGSGGREALLPGRLEGERVRADTVSQCQNDAGRCGTQECPVCRGAAGTPCGARRAHAAITYGTSLPLQRDGLDGASSRSPSRQDGTDGPRFDRVE